MREKIKWLIKILIVVLLEIHDMEPFRTNGVFSLSQNIQYALEVPQGWFGRKGVRPGAMVMTEQGTLPQTYFPKR